MFVPECADLENTSETYTFSYSIRMSLLPEGCVINGMPFSSCQLNWRHWIIRSNDVVVADTGGEAVIGQVRFHLVSCFHCLIFFQNLIESLFFPLVEKQLFTFQWRGV